MGRNGAAQFLLRRGLPRVSGDGPFAQVCQQANIQAAPRERGWALGFRFTECGALGCPA